MKANRAALVDFIEDSIRARRWAAGPGHAEAVKIAAKVTKRPVAALEYAWTHGDNYYDPNAAVNVARMQKNIDDLVKINLLKSSIKVSDVVDPSIAEEAAARVKAMN